MTEVTLNLVEAAKFLNMGVSTLYAQAKSGKVKGAKPAKDWVFLQSDLVSHIRGLYLVETSTDIENSKWQREQKNSTKEMAFGGTGSRIQQLLRKNEEAVKLAIGS